MQSSYGQGAQSAASLQRGKIVILNECPEYDIKQNDDEEIGDSSLVHQLVSLQRGKIIPNKCPEYDLKQFDDEASVLEICRICSSTSLPSLPAPL